MIVHIAEILKSKHGATYLCLNLRPRALFSLCKALSPVTLCNSDRSMARDIDITVSATFFQNSSLYHINIPPGMINVYVRSFSVPTHE